VSNATYTLPVRPALMDHGQAWPQPVWFGDYVEEEEVRDFNVIDAMAASGDYFITLATRLDKLAQAMEADSSEQIEIEHLVRTLFYMQEHYDLVAKYKRRR
jgi:hypothetical protein